MNLKKLHRWLPIIAGLFAFTACTEETPVEVGGGLLQGDNIRTFEIILESSSFLAYDSSFSGYTTPQDAPFAIVANKFGGVLDANALFRLAIPPAVINVRNTAGTVVSDSAPRYFSGRLVVRLDTLRSDANPPVQFVAHRIAEEWDRSATWTLRVDSGGVRRPWATPGGTRGAQIDTTTWTGSDTLVFRVDSQTIAQFRDTTNAARGVIVSTLTNGARVRVLSAILHLSARPSIRPDTIVTVDVVPAVNAFVFNPQPPARDELRVGGVPSWRTLIGLAPDLATRVIPCPGIANCQVQLSAASINRAELLLQPVTAPAGFIPEDTTFIQASGLLVSPGVPLQRSPIGTALALSDRIAPQLFAQPAATAPVAINVTNYLVALVNPALTATTRPPSALTLLAFSEPATFGFTTFARGPRLRLVVTAPVERTQ